MTNFKRGLFGLLSAFALLHSIPALGQQSPKAQKPFLPCGLGMVQNDRGLVPVSFQPVALKANHIRLSFAGHSTFVVETPKGVRIITTIMIMSCPAFCRTSSP